MKVQSLENVAPECMRPRQNAFSRHRDLSSIQNHCEQDRSFTAADVPSQSMLVRVRTAISILLAVIISCVVLANETPTDEPEEKPDEAFQRLVSELQIPPEALAELFSESYLTMKQYDAMQVAKRALPGLSADELVAMDQRYSDGISAAEFVDFLIRFGKDQPRHLKQNRKRKQKQEIEELTVYGYSFNHIPEEPEEFSVGDIRYMRSIREQANRLYRERRYSQAYPLLLNLAKRGFRDAQARLAYILFNGAGDVQKSNLRALGWLGAASAHPTEPGFRVLFNRYMRQVPEDAMPRVEAVVNGYREQFSHSEYQQCSTDHPYTMRHGSSIVKRTYCRFRLEAIADACFPYRCWADKVNTEPGEYFDLQPFEEKLQEALRLEQLERLLPAS